MNNSALHGLQIAGIGVAVTALSAASMAMANYHPTDPQQAMIVAAAAPIATGLIQGVIHWLQSKNA